MSAPSGQPQPGLLQFVAIALVFLLPLGLASWLYYGGSALQPGERTNHGTILEPLVNLRDALPNSRVGALSQDHWLLIYADNGACEASCRDALYRLRQSRLMLGKDMSRVERVFLHGDTAPDRVFLEEQHSGLIAIKDEDWSGLLADSRPRHLAAGGLFLVDPLGNLVLYFAPEIVPGDMVDDIEHLLDLSQIG